MPGIVGFARREKQASATSVVKTMLDTISSEWYQTEYYVNTAGTVAIGRSDLGIVNTAVQPHLDAEQGLAVFLYGDIIRSRAQSQPPSKVGGLLPWLGSLYRMRGGRFANDLVGEFVIAILDSRNNQLVVITDRYGRRPLYYTQEGDNLVFASEIRAILTVPDFTPKVDESAIAQFMTFGYILGEQTLLTNVTMLPPAGILRYDLDNGTLDISRYWSFSENLSPSVESDSIQLERITDTFRSAVNERLSDTQTAWLSLSGGMDSRAIAAVVNRSQYKVKAVTSGIRGGYDRIVTSRIAATIGCEHVFYEFEEQEMLRSASLVTDLIRESIAWTDGMRGTSSGAMTAFSARQRRERNLEIVLTGHGGEIAKLDKAYNLSLKGDQDLKSIANDPVHWAFTRMHRANAPRIDKTTLFRGALKDAVKEEPKNCLANIIDNLGQDIPAAQLVSFLFVNELYRKRALYALSVHRAYTEIRLPFYDDDFLQAVIGAPLHLRSNYTLHRHIINRSKPELLKIVLTETRMSPFAGKLERVFRGMPYHIGKKLGLFKRDFPEHFFAANADTEFFRRILLDPITLDRGYLNPDELSKLLDLHEGGRKDIYHLLHFLVISEFWHRDFIDRF